MKKTKLRKVLIVLTSVYVLAITLLSVLDLSSIDNPVELPYADKIVHFCFYFGLNFLLLTLLKAYHKSRRWIDVFFVCLSSVFYSYCLEVVQEVVGRDFSLYDLLANTVGVVVALCLFEMPWMQHFFAKCLKL